MHLSSLTLLAGAILPFAYSKEYQQPSFQIRRRVEGDDGHDHEGHGHGEGIEWSGIFDTPESSYIWIAQKVDGSYVDPTMKLAAIPMGSASEEMLEAAEEEGAHAMEEECEVVNHGDVIVPAMHKCFMLTFDDDRWETTFPIDASSTSAIAFFAQHLPTEFEQDTHYLKLVLSGEDIEPVAEGAGGHGEEGEKKPWGKTLGAAILINLVTLSGLIFVLPFISNIFKNTDPTFLYAGFASFAAGAILSCAFFLLLFEATHLIAEGWEEESESIWRWGTMILLGLILPVIVESLVGSIHSEPPAKEEDKDDKFKEEESGTDESSTENSPFAAKSFSEKARLIFSICFGDFMHNLCDGFFVGAAFSGCSDSKAWGIAIGTILHEIPQELSDFLILTGPQVGLSTVTALVINFVTGMSVLLGAVIVLALEVSNPVTGLLLAFGGGVYLQIGAVECMPKMVNPALTVSQKVTCIVSFILGTVLIGLVLLDHEHCGGHDHGHGH